jgi:hypothetical protein
MNTSDSIRLCLLGHSGVGKSPLTKLFKVDGWEPFRVRKPRSAADAKVCKSREEFQTLLDQHSGQTPLYQSPEGSENALRVYEDWSFFKVRCKDQCLEHTETAKNPATSLRIEIFAPVLVEILENLSRLDRAFHLNLDSLLIVLLNPISRSFVDMGEPTTELRLATHTAIVERSRVQGKGVDLADVIQRVQHLDCELVAWRRISEIVSNTVECKSWPHFEYRYSLPDGTTSDARVELTKARSSLLTALQEQKPGVVESVKQIMRTPEEIMLLDDIV